MSNIKYIYILRKKINKLKNNEILFKKEIFFLGINKIKTKKKIGIHKKNNNILNSYIFTTFSTILL